MPKKPAKRVKKRNSAAAVPSEAQATNPSAHSQDPARQAAAGQPSSALDTLKQNLTGRRKAIFQILDDVKKVRPEQWQDPNQVEQLAREFANKLGIPVPEQRIKAFVNAYKDATKNGPNANVDDLLKKYGQNVDEKTLQEIKKFVPKSK